MAPFIYALFFAVPAAVVALFLAAWLAFRLRSPFRNDVAEIFFRLLMFVVLWAVSFAVILLALVALALWIRL